jgi:hypothetical protein
VPHIVLLDAGLAARFDPAVYTHVRGFFAALVSTDGRGLSEAILGLDPAGQAHCKDQAAFVAEAQELFDQQRAEFKSGRGRAGDNLRAHFACVRFEIALIMLLFVLFLVVVYKNIRELNCSIIETENTR